MSKVIKIILVIIIIFTAIPLAGTVFNYFTKNKLGDFGLQNEEIKRLIQEKELNIAKIKSTGTETQEPEQSYQEFIGFNDRLKLSYPSNWLRIEGENLEKFQEKIGGHGLNTLFLALNASIETFGQIIIQEGNFNNQQGFEQIIEEMKRINQEQGWGMEIIDLEIKEKEASFEAIYRKEDRYDARSKERLVIIETEEEKKVALIAFISFDKNWPEFQEQADFIMDSVIVGQ